MRRRAAVKRQVLADPKFGSQVLSKFINHVMLSGKKSLAETLVYDALEMAFKKSRTGKPAAKKADEEEGGESGGAGSPIELFEQVLDNVRPTVEVKSRRVGGSTYQVPVEVSGSRSTALAMRWIVDAAKGRSEKSMVNKLAAEMLDAYHGRGTAMKKREDTHRMAKANQAFAHYRW